eukprot:3206891-Amphidinium_carterae.1
MARKAHDVPSRTTHAESLIVAVCIVLDVVIAKETLQRAQFSQKSPSEKRLPRTVSSRAKQRSFKQLSHLLQ